MYSIFIYDTTHLLCVYVIAARLGDPGQWQQTQEGQLTGAAGVGDPGQRQPTEQANRGQASEPGYMYMCDSVGFQCVCWLSVSL